MTRRRRQIAIRSMMILTAVAIATQAIGQEALTRSTFVVGDVLVTWRAGHGTSITYRGIPVFMGNAGEWIVHQKWTTIFHHQGYGEETATLVEAADGSTLSIANATDDFEYEKQIVVGTDGSIRVEYKYTVLGPETADLQMLWGLGKQWIDESTYRVVTGGEEKTGELTCPDTGRKHPWSGATEQVFTTDYGTLTLKTNIGLALYAQPRQGTLWWGQPMKKGETYTQVVDVGIEPGPAADTGVTLAGIDWPDRIRDGNAEFTLKLARTATGPERITARVELASGSKLGSGAPVEAALGVTPTEVTCGTRIEQRGVHSFAVVIADAATDEELLRIAPLNVEVSPMMRVLPRLSLYTDEAQAEIVVDVAEDVELDGLTIAARAETGQVVTAEASTRRAFVPLDATALPDGETAVQVRLQRGDEVVANATTMLRKAPPKANAVKIDRISRGLIVDGLPHIPFGYYTYYPLKDGVMDEEVVRGFNLFSPYHGGPHDAEAREPIREYLERCAAIGMKVNYHLMWANQTELSEEQWAALREEIEAFKDHPAILTWYIADEPTEDRIPTLEAIKELLREIDPYHPVTVVFYRGADHARKFAGTMDIVMGDPYPIPNMPVTYVSGMSDSLNAAFDFGKPLWIVPQAFGGGEHWGREPTAKEQRVMTYLSLIHGARGIQYFIRSPRASFPKSPVMWAECGALAMETAEVTPALTSAEPAPKVASSVPAVHAAAFLDRGIVTILATNTENRPLVPRFTLDGIDFTGEAEVLFEDRKVAVTGGVIEEPIDAFGSRAYAIPVGPLPVDDIEIAEGNLARNPSWENNPSVGTPSGNYGGVAHGSTVFVDSRTARHGRHSVRLTAPSDDATPSMGSFPVNLTGGQAYRVSIWAKGLTDDVKLKLSMGKLIAEEPPLTTEWQEFSYTVTPEKDGRRGLGIALASAGVAWVDLYQIVPVGE